MNIKRQVGTKIIALTVGDIMDFLEGLDRDIPIEADVDDALELMVMKEDETDDLYLNVETVEAGENERWAEDYV